MASAPIERRLLRGHLCLVYFFLYGPIVVLVAGTPLIAWVWGL